VNTNFYYSYWCWYWYSYWVWCVRLHFDKFTIKARVLHILLLLVIKKMCTHS